MRALLLIPLLLLLAACEADPLEQGTPMPNGVVVELVARVEGCRVYRLRDVGDPVYTTICGSETVTTSTVRTVTCGKNCVKHIPMMDVNDRRGR